MMMKTVPEPLEVMKESRPSELANVERKSDEMKRRSKTISGDPVERRRRARSNDFRRK